MVRLKHRYLLVNILYPEDSKDRRHGSVASNEDTPLPVQFRRPSDDRVDAKMLARLIRDGVFELFGDYGSGMTASSLQVKYFSSATSTAIIRVARDHYRLVWFALAFISRLPKPVDQNCVIQVVRVSGTIKKAEEEAIRRARITIRRAQMASRRAKGSNIKHATASTQALSVDDEGRDDELGFANGIEGADGLGDVDDESE